MTLSAPIKPSVDQKPSADQKRVEQECEPREMAIPGTHERLLELIQRYYPQPGACRVLDLGAGQGALSKRLKTAGYNVAACDMDASNFFVEDVECREVDANGILPYEQGAFDLVLTIEVVEHIENHSSLFNEVTRILKPQGLYIFSTPNILSLKYRMGFLFTGYGYSFGPLTPGVKAPATQHISPFSLDRYNWLLSLCGLKVKDISTDKLQSSSKWFYWLAPLIRFFARRIHGDEPQIARQNSKTALLGRKLFVVCEQRVS